MIAWSRHPPAPGRTLLRSPPATARTTRCTRPLAIRRCAVVRSHRRTQHRLSVPGRGGRRGHAELARGNGGHATDETAVLTTRPWERRNDEFGNAPEKLVPRCMQGLARGQPRHPPVRPPAYNLSMRADAPRRTRSPVVRVSGSGTSRRTHSSSGDAPTPPVPVTSSRAAVRLRLRDCQAGRVPQWLSCCLVTTTNRDRWPRDAGIPLSPAEGRERPDASSDDDCVPWMPRPTWSAAVVWPANFFLMTRPPRCCRARRRPRRVHLQSARRSTP